MGVSAGITDAEIQDGDYDFKPALVGGATMAARAFANSSPQGFDENHLAAEPALMFPSTDTGIRHLPSATDVLAAATGSNWSATEIRLDRTEFLVVASTNWHNRANWLGNRVPDAGMDAYLRDPQGGTLDLDVRLTANAVAGNVFIREGADLSAQSFKLDATGDVEVADPGSRLLVSSGGEVEADLLRLFASGDVSLFGNGLIDVRDLTLSFNSQLVGRNAGVKTIDVSGTLNNNGVIRAEGGADLELVSTASNPWNLDGTNENGVVEAVAGNITVLQGALRDAFSGTMTIGPNRQIYFAAPWIFDGDLDLNGGGSLATYARIRGNDVALSGGTIDVSGVGGIDARATFGNNVLVRLANASSTLFVGQPTLPMTLENATFQGPGTLVFQEDVTVAPNRTATVNVNSFDWDGPLDDADATIQSNATLRILGNAIQNHFGTVTINSGTLEVSTALPWNQIGPLRLNNGGRVLGSARMDVNGSLPATGLGNRIESPTAFKSAARVTVGGSGELILAGVTTYEGGGYSGAGVLRQQGAATAAANTSIGIDQGIYLGTSGAAVLQAPLWLQVFDWDGPGGGTSARTTVNPGVTLTINAVQIDDDPGGDGYDGIVAVNGGTLLVNTGPRVPLPFAFPPGFTQQAPVQPVPTPWRLDGTMNLAGGSTPAVVATAIGSPMLIYGDVNATTGQSTIQLATLVSGTIHVAGGATLTGQGLTVGGGHVSVSAGGTLRLAGATLQPATSATVHGQMQIQNAAMRGGTWGGAGLIAQNGTLGIQESTSLGVRSDFNAGSTTTVSSGRILETSAGGAVADGATIAGGVFRNTSTNGLFLADGAEIGSSFENHGRLVLFDSANVVAQASVASFAQSAAGRMEVKLGGTAAQSFDSLAVADAATLDGSLAAVLYNGFTPALGASFDILTAGSLTGAFASTSLPPLGGGLGWAVNYGTTSVRLSVVAVPSYSADFDEDGDVDGVDLSIWKGAAGVNALADADADGDSDGADLLLWQRQLGGGTAVSATAAVPEPTGALSGLVVAAAIVARSRR